MCFGDTPDIVPRILRDEVDCMVTSARLVAPGLGVARLHEEEYVFVGADSALASDPSRVPKTPRVTCSST